VACTDDSCDEAGDAIVNAPNDGLCDNGIFCDGVETCDQVLDCQAGQILDGVPCADGNLCNGDEMCEAGVCVHRNPLDCDDSNECTDDLCSQSLGCQYLNNSRPCDDADACSDGDVCGDGVCTSGGPLDCDDSNVCTADSCDQVLGCAHDPIPECMAVPSASLGGRVFLGLLLMSAGALFLVQRRRFSG
jgi:hypothetical protein